MQQLKAILTCLIIILLFSCKAMNKTAVRETNIPADIGKSSYKILITEIDFNSTTSKSVAEVHNNAARSYVKKNLKGYGEFIPEMEMGGEKYENRDVYRYALMSETNTRLEKTYSDGKKTNQFITNFYFYDRLNGQKLPVVGASTTALWMLKAIVDKIKKTHSQ